MELTDEQLNKIIFSIILAGIFSNPKITRIGDVQNEDLAGMIFNKALEFTQAVQKMDFKNLQ